MSFQFQSKINGKTPFPYSPLFPTLEMKFTEIQQKVKQKLSFFTGREDMR